MEQVNDACISADDILNEDSSSSSTLTASEKSDEPVRVCPSSLDACISADDILNEDSSSSSTLTASEKSDEPVRVCPSSPLRQWDYEDEKNLLILGSSGAGPSLEELERCIRPVGFAGTDRGTSSAGAAAPLVASRELTRGIPESPETCSSDSQGSLQGWQFEFTAGEMMDRVRGMAEDRARYFHELLNHSRMAFARRGESVTPPPTRGFENTDAAVLNSMDEMISRIARSPTNFLSGMFDAPMQTATVGDSKVIKQEVTAEQNAISFGSSPESHEEAGGSDVMMVGSDQSILGSHEELEAVVVTAESLLVGERIFHATNDVIVLVDLGWFHNREPGVTARAALAHTGVCATKLLLWGVKSNPKCFDIPHHASNYMATDTLSILMNFIGAHDRTDPAYQTIFRHLRDFSATDAFLAHALDHGNFPPRLHALQERAMALRNQPHFVNAEYMVCQYLALQTQRYIEQTRTLPSCFRLQQQKQQQQAESTP